MEFRNGLMLLLWLSVAGAFNIEVRKVVRKVAPAAVRGGRFGHSVSFHSTNVPPAVIGSSTDS